MQLSVLSYNIHKGVNPARTRSTLDAIKASVQKIGADIVFLQEVRGQALSTGNLEKKELQTQFEYLADTIWPHFAYGKNAVYADGHHGNAILSKYPITHWENYDVSTNRFEQRGVLHVSISIPGEAKPVHALCLHFNLLAGGQEKQLKELCRIASDHIPPDEGLIVAGDFNDWSKQASGILCQTLGVVEAFQAKHGTYAKSFPARMPLVPLDRIYVRNFQTTKAEVLNGSEWKSLSDHAALFAVLQSTV